MPPIQYISKNDIPERLTRIYPELRKLYCRGKMPNFSKYKFLAVVGARRYSEYGERVCKHLIAGLKGYPIVIVSGLALGIDSISHESALENSLLTIAVPGSGLDERAIYPKSKLPLARRILDAGGCLLSEYDSNEPTGPWVFPERNRIMAGLADAVLIIEAEKKSGTLITARLALDYNKEVLTVPTSIFSQLSEGPHFLLKQGAGLATSSRDIVETLDLEWKETDQKEGSVDGHLPLNVEKYGQKRLFEPSNDTDKFTEEEEKILELLPTTKDDIISKIGASASDIGIRLSLLEIKGAIKAEYGRYVKL